MDLDLKNRRAMVCGSTQGIGHAAALEIAKMGAELVLVARDAGRLTAVCEELDKSLNQKHSFLTADFSDPDALKSTLADFFSDGSGVHILVNNTGGPPAGPAAEAELSQFLAAFQSHLICNQILVQAVLPGMKSAGYGRIINIISTSVKQPIPGLGVSNTIRGAVANWAKTLAGELGPHGITVNNVLPGATNTGRLTALIGTKAKKQQKTTEEVAAQMKSEIPARRFGESHELAAAIGFLASPAAGYINGVNLPVDGGRTACL